MPDSRIVLVTGGNKGLGFETARRLKEAGDAIYIGARDEEKGRAAADELGVSWVHLDVTDEESVSEAAAELERREGHLDVLVNNAATNGPRKDAADLTGSDATLLFDTNVVGIVRVIHGFLPLLQRSVSPVIVNVSTGLGSFALTQDPSRATGTAAARLPLYSASKAAVNMMTTQYAKAFPHIRINAANPGYTTTDMTDDEDLQLIAQSATEGTDAIVELAGLGADGPTGTFWDRKGAIGW